MVDWSTATVESCLESLSLRKIPKVLARDYKPSGSYPIIDQGQNLIAGWTDDDSVLISTDLPIVIFGDHTRVFKYIDFPFVKGADGTQLLKPKVGIEPLFFYYACRAINLPSRGYNRHFKALKEKEIPIPPIGEQLNIARTLRRIDDAISLQDEQLQVATDMKRTAMRELFTRGLRGEAQKETEIGPIPKSWVIETINDHFSVVSGGTPPRRTPTFWIGGMIPWVKTTEVDYCVIQKTEEHITQAGLDRSPAKLLPPDTLLLAMYGQGVTRGKVAILGIEAACNQACAAINPHDNVVNTKYLYHFLSFRYEAIRRLAHGGQQQNLNLDIVRGLPIAYPTNPEVQGEIVAILNALDYKIELHQKKRAVLDDLFKALLHKLMTREIRVEDLDLSIIGSSRSRPYRQTGVS